MTKKGNGLRATIAVVMWLLAILMALAVGGLFVSGTTLSYPVLKWITSATAHVVVGWTIIGLTLLSAILKIFVR